MVTTNRKLNPTELARSSVIGEKKRGKSKSALRRKRQELRAKLSKISSSTSAASCVRFS